MKKKYYVIEGAVLAAAAATAVVLRSCKTTPAGVVPVKPFDLHRYLGTWYEIARLDYMFEKHLKEVSAEYSLNENGTMKVVNRGYDVDTDQWEVAVGKAKFAGAMDEGRLKVSFFGPFYAGYNVVEVDPEYKYALVAGRNHNYLWLLSREKTMPEEIKQKYLQKAADLGYDISQLIWTPQQ